MFTDIIFNLMFIFNLNVVKIITEFQHKSLGNFAVFFFVMSEKVREREKEYF